MNDHQDMKENYILLATPQIYTWMQTDMTLFSKVLNRIDAFMADGLLETQRECGAYSFSIQNAPRASVFFLASENKNEPDFLILSGAGDGLGPPEHNLCCKAKGVFPTRSQIRAGNWTPLKRIHLA